MRPSIRSALCIAFVLTACAKADAAPDTTIDQGAEVTSATTMLA